MSWCRALLGLALLCLAGCAAALDSEQLRLCRAALPALHPDGTGIREIRHAPAAPGGVGIRIDYATQEAGQAARARFAACGFAGKSFERGRLDLTSVETDEGALGEARLLYLKRFWLADFEARIGERASVEPSGPALAPAVAYALQQVINAVALAAVYALLATAYSLIYGLVGRINLAFGEIAVIGGYGAIAGVFTAAALGAGPVAALALALALGAALAALWSLVIGRAVIARLHARHRLGQPILVATIAVAIALQEFLRLSQSARERWVPPVFNAPLGIAHSGDFAVTVTPMQIAVAAIAFAASASVLLLLARSRFGREWRAFADDPAAAALFGVNARKLMAETFVLAGLLAGLTGWIIATYYGSVSFYMGTALGLKALVAAVVGGIGSIPGAFLGGVLVALIEAFWSAYFDITYRDVVVYALLVIVFVLRPGGLIGFAGPTPREV
jgi:branched-subunit amino acid ABC-type transport system permease component